MMAAANSYESFECSVCLDSMLDKRPVVLSCMHTFCTPCVTELYKRPPLSCPTCRTVTTLPDGDIGKLPVNCDLVKYLEREKEMKKDLVNCCEFCLRKGQKKESSGICTQCVKKLCRDCIEKHKQMAAFKTHQIASNTPSSGQGEEKFCALHSESLQYACMKCLECLCIYCITDEEHGDHPDQIEILEKGIKNLRKERNQHKTQVDEYMDKLLRTKEAVTSDIIDLNKSKDDLNDLRLIFQKKLFEMDNLQQQLSDYEETMRKSSSKVEEIIDQTRRYQEFLKATNTYTDMQFLGHCKTTTLDQNFILQMEETCNGLLQYSVPKFEKNEIVANKNFSRTPIGRIVEFTKRNSCGMWCSYGEERHFLHEYNTTSGTDEEKFAEESFLTHPESTMESDKIQETAHAESTKVKQFEQFEVDRGRPPKPIYLVHSDEKARKGSVIKSWWYKYM